VPSPQDLPAERPAWPITVTSPGKDTNGKPVTVSYELHHDGHIVVTEVRISPPA
jgi:hypothetical protein